jgi:hypothetical protein
MPIPLLLLCIVALLLTSGCAARKPKSDTRLYQGDAPSIRITGEESAGGPLRER